jgi:rare lipoprotein A
MMRRLSSLATASLISFSAIFCTLPNLAEAQTGMASYYKHGKRTANGERFNPNGLTAAHRTLKFGTKVRVTHLKTRKSVIVRINDRGPFIRGRIIDLAHGAARAVGLKGTGKVEIVVVK